MKLAPIALFVYNRPQHARETVDTLKKNSMAGQSDLFIFSDAPKDKESEIAVREVREFIRNIYGFKSITIVEREHNLGLAVSVIDGVTRLCHEFGSVIVLEDDLLVSPNFLEYMNSSLEHYRDDARVMQVSGYMFPVELESDNDAVFLPLTTSWGWATWERAWRHFDPAAPGYEKLKRDPGLRIRFNLDGSYDYFGMLELQLLGKVDSWAIRWYLTVFLLDGLVLFPVKSMVRNIGFDGSGTHQAIYRMESGPSEFIVTHYPEVIVEQDALAAVNAYLESQRQGGRWMDAGRKVLRAWQYRLRHKANTI